MVGVRNEREGEEDKRQATQVHHCNWSHCKEQASVALWYNEKQKTENE